MWLADTAELGVRSEEDEGWLDKTWDRLIFHEAGVKVHAVVLGKDIYADYSMEKFKSMASAKYKKDGVQLGVFLNLKNAYEWMKKVSSGQD